MDGVEGNASGRGGRKKDWNKRKGAYASEGEEKENGKREKVKDLYMSKRGEHGRRKSKETKRRERKTMGGRGKREKEERGGRVYIHGRRGEGGGVKGPSGEKGREETRCRK